MNILFSREFWSPTLVSERMRSGRISTREKLLYLLVWLVVFILPTSFYLIIPADYTISGYDYISGIGYIFTIVLGTIYLYKLYPHKDTFIEYYIVVSSAALWNIIFYICIPLIVLSTIFNMIIFGDDLILTGAT